MNRRSLVLFLWLTVLSTALYFYLFQRDSLERLPAMLSQSPPVWAYAAYLAIGCIRCLLYTSPSPRD